MVVKWTFVFLVGLFTGIVAFGINLAVENVAGLKFVYTVNLMTSERLVHTLVFPLLMLASLLLKSCQTAFSWKSFFFFCGC